MEHSQGTICVFVCVSACMCEVMLGWESLPATAEAKGRTHHHRGTHTKSSTIAIKSKAISLLLAIHTRSVLTHACSRTYTYTNLTNTTIQYAALLLGYLKSVERNVGGNEWHSDGTSSPNLNKMCQQWEYKISEWEFFGIGDMERNQFQGQVWCQGHPEGHSSVDLFISICSLLQTENATVCSAASLRNIAPITVP